MLGQIPIKWLKLKCVKNEDKKKEIKEKKESKRICKNESTVSMTNVRFEIKLRGKVNL